MRIAEIPGRVFFGTSPSRGTDVKGRWGEGGDSKVFCRTGLCQIERTRRTIIAPSTFTYSAAPSFFFSRARARKFAWKIERKRLEKTGRVEWGGKSERSFASKNRSDAVRSLDTRGAAHSGE